MIGSKLYPVCAILLLLWRTAGLAADFASTDANRYVAVVRTNSDQDAYVLKVGHATFDGFTKTVSSPVFVNLTERLKRMCQNSHSGRTNSPAGQTDWLRPIEVDIALGSDYQVLDWLATARIDAALICSTALQFYNSAKKGGIDRVCLVPADGTDAAVAYQPKLRSFNQRDGPGQPRRDPERDYQLFLASIAQSSPSPSSQTYRLISPSHLSAAGFIGPVAYANKWLKQVFPRMVRPGQSAATNFWGSFFGHLEFSLGRTLPPASASGPPPSTVVIEFSPDALPTHESPETGWTGYKDTRCIALPWLTNVLVIRSALANKLLSPRTQIHWLMPTNVDSVVESLLADHVLQKFLQPNFTIAELVHLLRADQEASGQDELALVLSGGGVKAAYQSRLVDHLYGERLLSNSTNDPAALHVKSIIGNSGGALLGFFVADLRDKDPRKLSDILWTRRGKLLTDRDIFGFMDLPRWASFVVCGWVLIAVLRVAPCRKDPAGQLPRGENARGLPWCYSATMLALLLLTPILLQIVNAEYGMEHVPEAEGFFYFVCQCLMLLIDSCLVPREARESAGPPPRWRFLTLGTGLFSFGWAVAAVQLVSKDQPWCKTILGDDVITVGGLAFCCGVLISWVGWILWTREQNRYRLDQVSTYLRTVIMALAVIILVYLTMRLLVFCGMITFLELTPAFWIALVLLTVAWSLVYLCISTAKRRPWWCPGWLRRCAQQTFQYQRSRHPSGTFGLTRLVRCHLLFTFCFFYWNAVVAPAVYGNRQARTYLEETARLALAETKQYELQTLYAAPANDLAENRERYFLFYPERLSNTFQTMSERLNSDARKRWTALQFYHRGDEMRRVVFASGSPFPIFSPHAIEFKGARGKERLVDGGYAHNIPLEAAREIGARQVLLLNASPAKTPTTNINRVILGQLSRNLPRLVPFLFNRSQVADLLIREEMFTVSLSPAPDRKWPSLFDFRRSKVEYLLKVAQNDTRTRIGRIETCGPPVFHVSIRMGRYPK